MPPLHPHELLRYMAVPGLPSVYLVGSFARHVTIYSQQIRAINLIDALCRIGQIGRSTSVIVVGAGVAGLTAAAAALVRGASVTLVEQGTDLAPIQSEAGARYLHPHIYDWPLQQGQGSRAGLPLLDWEAGPAASVFEGFRRDWNEIAERFHIGPPLPLKVRDIRREGNLLHVMAANGEQAVSGQIVILAIGFGRERSRADYQTYWQDSPLNSDQGSRLKWLVSGFGDGALTDLMRLCVRHFRHVDFVESFAQDQDLAVELKSLLEKPSGSAEDTFQRMYPSVKGRLSAITLRTDTQVVLNAPPNYLEINGSAILNRFIVFHLEKSGAFTLLPGRMVTEPEIPQSVKGKYHIVFENPAHREDFDRIVARHGPAPALNQADMPSLHQACEELRAQWNGLRERGKQDRTRVPLFDWRDYSIEQAPNSPAEPEDSFASSPKPRYLVLESSQQRQPQRLSWLVQSAVSGQSFRRNMEAVLLHPEAEDEDDDPPVEAIGVNEALASQSAFNRTVRALCLAEIAIIDVTDYEPGTMLLLGIRTIARRGVTIVTTNQALTNKDWSKLPFNLKEIYPQLAGNATELGKLISTAWAQYKGMAHYQDLPAWQAARQTGKNDAAIDPEKGILWLCSFSEEYTKEGYEEYLQTKVGDRFEADSKLLRITEIVSPQLLAQRLYSAIRFRKLCIVDWTFWSPNVFFELGVRLAINRFGPVCLLAERAADRVGISDGVRAQRKSLIKLFAPIRYDVLDKAPNPFPEIRSRYEQMKNAEAPRRRSPIPPAFGYFPYDHTYKRMTEFLDLREEPGGLELNEFLGRILDSLIGEGVSKPGSPVLFADSKPLAEQVRNCATAIGIAAWLYMNYKLLPETALKTILKNLTDETGYLAGDGEDRRRQEELGDRLLPLLRMSPKQKDSELAEAIAKVQDRLREPAPNPGRRPEDAKGEIPS
jgi:FAD dependent oxidoreductase